MTTESRIAPHLREWVEPTTIDMTEPPYRHNGLYNESRLAVCAHVGIPHTFTFRAPGYDMVQGSHITDPVTRAAVYTLCLRVVASDDPLPPYAFLDLLADLLDGGVS